MMKRVLAAALTLPLFLAACSQSATPMPENAGGSQAPSIEIAPGTLRLSGNLNGQTFKAPVASVTIGAQALGSSARLTVSEVNQAQAPLIPPVKNVHSAYIMGEVKQKMFLKAWRVQMSPATFEQPAVLSVNQPPQVKAQQATDPDVTEVFLHDNVRGTDQLVGTYRGDVPLDITDFADRVNEQRGQGVDFTYTAYRTPWANYVEACRTEQGDTELGYCSFRNKKVASSVKAQGLGRSIRTLSWNVGNVAITCQAYLYKLCYQATERRISDQILALEQNGGKFDIIALQELWHGNCDAAGIGTSWWSSSINPRLCDNPTRGRHSIHRILGDRYTFTCTSPGYNAVARQYTNGFECTALNPATTYFTQLPYLGTSVGYHPDCPTPAESVDTGYLAAQVGFVSSEFRLVTLNAHLAGTNKSACRAAQLNTLAADLRTRNRPANLIMGDFNTEPYNDDGAGGAAFRQVFSTPLRQQAADPIATLIDAGTQPTAYYVGYTPSLDHVLSNALTGWCSNGAEFNGTDHVLTTCNLHNNF